MQALLEVFQTHAETIWKTVYRLVSNEDDAKECVQQTFLDASKIDSTEVANWRAILLKIATRRAMDVLRDRYSTVHASDACQESAYKSAPRFGFDIFRAPQRSS